MSWPSAYGYKYTPIGLRQREKKDDASGTRSICTTVHLPQGGHLLDIERQYGLDGSMSKRETQNLEPSAFSPSPINRPAPAVAEPASSSPFLDFEPRAPSDFERQADDIIANFRARQGLPLEAPSSALATAGESKISSLLSSSATSSSAVKEETKVSATSRVRRAMRKAEEDSYF